MSFRCHSPNVRCLAPEQVVHLQYYTNSLFEDDLQSSSRQFCHHHDPYHEQRLFKLAIQQDPSRREKNRVSRNKQQRADVTEGEASISHLPVLSAEDPYLMEFWASAIDQMVLDFCCAMVDQPPIMLSDATARPAGSSSTMSAAVQVLEPSKFGRCRRRRRSGQPQHP
jgi:hypothetical protein